MVNIVNDLRKAEPNFSLRQFNYTVGLLGIVTRGGMGW